MYITKEDVKLKDELICKPLNEDDPNVKATKLFRDNVNLVGFIAKRYKNSLNNCTSYLDYDDLLQTGYMALWIASCKFDESLGYAFSTFAVAWINGYMLRALRDSDALKIPRKHVDIRSLLNKYDMELPLTPEEIQFLLDNKSKDSRITYYDLERFSDVEYLSLDYKLNGNEEDPGADLGDMIPDKNVTDIANSLNDEELDKAIEATLELIKPIYRDMVEEWIYSVLAEEPVRQVVLTEKYQISQAQVHRVLKQSVSIFQSNKKHIREIFGED